MFESYSAIARKVWDLHKKLMRSFHYADILALHAMARLGKIDGDMELIDEIRQRLAPFVQWEVPNVIGAYGPTVYRFGGNATAFMVARGLMPEAEVTLLKSAEMLCTQQPRNKEGIFEWPQRPNQPEWHDFIWIDSVFGVCPFLLWAGKVFDRQEFIDESVKQMLGHHRRLFDPALKLYFQAFNAWGSGILTPGHWSRGEGWGLLALAELLYDLPKDHPGYGELLQAYRDNLEGCAASQDGSGMWHQAMEMPESYLETSGTALILYAISRGLKNGSVAETDHERFLKIYLKGLKALLGYIGLDGSVYNASSGCLAPGQGSGKDYAEHPWKRNDNHGTAAVMICLSQAETLCTKLKMIPTPEELINSKEI